MVHKIKFAVFFIITLIVVLLCVNHHNETETNLLRTLMPQTSANFEEMLAVADKSSSVIKVVFEDKDEEHLNELYKQFTEQTDKNDFEINSTDISKLLKIYTKNPANFLSYGIRKNLKYGNYDLVYTQSINDLYNPTGLQITDFEKDPYLLLDKYINSRNNIFNKIHHDNGLYYDSLSVKIKGNDALSPDSANKKIAKIIKLQKELSKNGGKIYLAGTPIHSYYTSQKAKSDINIICLLSTILIILLTYFYFKNLKLLIPIAVSIAFGMLTGYTATKLWFDTFLIITMVFSTTLIGVGIDYSYHYFFSEQKDKTFYKNLTFSFLTTIVPFVIVYFTKIELLQQIAVFSVFGLFGIYFTLVFLYPCFKTTKPEKAVIINKKTLKVVLSILFIMSLAGIFRFHFNDTLSSLYKPNKQLQQAEALYNKISGNNVTNTIFITVKKPSFEARMEAEEKITDLLSEKTIDFMSLSKIIPSQKRQAENFELVNKLYENNLQNYSNILSLKQIQALKNQKFTPVETDIAAMPFLKNFVLNPDTTIIYAFSKNLPEISDNNIKIINIQQDTENQMRKYRQTLSVVFAISALVLVIILTFFYGIKQSVKILAPSVFGMVCALFLTSLICGEVNFFGIISVFLILGFTMDYSIFRTSGKNKTETAIAASCLTTSFSFLLLAFCGFKLLSTMAMVIFFGIIIAYMTGYLIFNKQ